MDGIEDIRMGADEGIDEEVDHDFEGADMEFQDNVPERGDNEPGVTLDELRTLVKALCQEAVDYSEEDLAAKRMKRWEAYEGEYLPGDADLDDTRSTVISRDVHDTVHKILPSIMRIFCGGSAPVEYLPEGMDQIEMAKQATDYVHSIVLAQDNDFYNVMYSAAHDALVKGLGVFKWWWEEKKRVEGSSYSGLDDQQFQVLASDPDVEVVEYQEIMDPMFGKVISCSINRTTYYDGKLVIEAVPPEERLINQKARSIDDSVLYGHRREMTVSELVSLGFNFEQVIRFSSSNNLDTNEEAVERLDNETFNQAETSSDKSQHEVEVVELYLDVDLDGDGIAEKYRIYCGGNSYTILEWADGDLAIDLCEEVPFAELCPDPIPHIATGKATSDAVMDVQRVKSNLLRGSLDSLSRAIFPREEVVEGKVNMQDVMNPEIGAVIRTRLPGMIREITTPFMGKECLPMLGYMDEVKADRTGISDATTGLNPQSLQSSTQDAVENTISASQTQIEMIARHFANGVKRMFIGILATIKQNQDKVRTVRLRNEWVPVDPREWNVQMDCAPSVALGRGSEKDRINHLLLIASKQEQLLQQMGPQNGLVTLAEYRNTLAEIVHCSGYFHAEQFFLPAELGEQVQQLKTQLDAATARNQELEQQTAFMSEELMKRSKSASNKDDASAEQSRATAFEKTVGALHEAGQAVVEGAQVVDELALHNVIIADEPQGPVQ